MASATAACADGSPMKTDSTLMNALNKLLAASLNPEVDGSGAACSHLPTHRILANSKIAGIILAVAVLTGCVTQVHVRPVSQRAQGRSWWESPANREIVFRLGGMNTNRSDTLVFFGVTGDLAYKNNFPALHAMVKRGNLNVPVIGVAKAGWNLDQLKARAKDSVEKHGGLDPAAFDKLCGLLRYVDGDYNDTATFQALHRELGNAQVAARFLAYGWNVLSLGSGTPMPSNESNAHLPYSGRQKVGPHSSFWTAILVTVHRTNWTRPRLMANR